MLLVNSQYAVHSTLPYYVHEQPLALALNQHHFLKLTTSHTNTTDGVLGSVLSTLFHPPKNHTDL